MVYQLKNLAISELLAAKPKEENPEEPVKQPTSINKIDLLEDASLKTKGEVDAYIERLKAKLYKYISDGGIDIK